MTNLNKFDTHESFYHGLVKSKLWLCEELETAIYRECLSKPSLHILGCWDNLLAFMLLTRKPEFYNKINCETSFDIIIYYKVIFRRPFYNFF